LKQEKLVPSKVQVQVGKRLRRPKKVKNNWKYRVEKRMIRMPDGTEREVDVKVYPPAGSEEYRKLLATQERALKRSRTPRLTKRQWNEKG
jgi:hypothetical protein